MQAVKGGRAHGECAEALLPASLHTIIMVFEFTYPRPSQSQKPSLSFLPTLVITLLLRLPPGVLVSFRMVDMDAADGGEDDEADKELTGLEGRAHTKASAKASASSSSAAAAAASMAVAEVEGSSGRTARGLCVGLTWMQPGGQALQVCERR